MSGTDRLSRRALNRALLQRQMLIQTADMTVPAALEHLVGMQAQMPNPPYLGYADLRALDLLVPDSEDRDVRFVTVSR